MITPTHKESSPLEEDFAIRFRFDDENDGADDDDDDGNDKHHGEDNDVDDVGHYWMMMIMVKTPTGKGRKNKFEDQHV